MTAETAMAHSSARLLNNWANQTLELTMPRADARFTVAQLGRSLKK